MKLPPIRFGTDGVRGPAGSWPITNEGAARIGGGTVAALGRTVFVGRDTRESGPELVAAVMAGVQAAGGIAVDAGVLPTAALSCLVKARGGAAAVMVTASHNPWEDNGLKVLRGDGRKPSPDDAAALEAAFATHHAAPQGGEQRRDEAPLQPWKDTLPDVNLTGRTFLVDAAHGAAHSCAPAALEARGATVVRVGCAPSGRNINHGVGATHPPDRSVVAEAGAELGICLDGDADRVVLVHPTLGLLDGDDILWLLGRDGTTVVGTVMSNGGLDAALGGRLVRARVGDKHVAAKMVEHDAPIGAEPSGHVLFADGMPTGDGTYAALRVLAAIGDRDLGAAVQGWQRWPVAQKNVRFSGERVPLDALTSLAAAEAAGNRFVVRYSGTEPKLRILVEGDAAEDWVARIAAEFVALQSGGAAQ